MAEMYTPADQVVTYRVSCHFDDNVVMVMEVGLEEDEAKAYCATVEANSTTATQALEQLRTKRYGGWHYEYAIEYVKPNKIEGDKQ